MAIFRRTHQFHGSLDRAELKVAGNQYYSELRLDQKDHIFKFNYSYAPCYLTDLGKGKLADFCGKNLTAERKSPSNVPVAPGHVYLLNQIATNRNVLFTMTIGEPIRIGQSQPDGIPRRKDSPRMPSVVAHYNFDGHPMELNGTAYPMDIRNVQFSDTAMILNGKSEQVDRKNGFRAGSLIPGIDPGEFTLRIRLKPTGDSTEPQPIFVGGAGFHWLILERKPSGELIISLNHGKFTQSVPNIRISKDTWTTLICAVSASQKVVAVADDSGKPVVIQLPANLSMTSALRYSGSQQIQFARSSPQALAFCGEIDELTLLNGVMTQGKFDAIIKRLRALK
ncbi:MAG: hypothetical protein R3C20_03455 [Planctomycetaceae bacterium]